jgi:hypothetical protein
MPTSIRSQDLLAHLEQVVSWNRHVNSDPSTGNLLIRDSFHQASLKVLELAFLPSQFRISVIDTQPPKAPSDSAIKDPVRVQRRSQNPAGREPSG